MPPRPRSSSFLVALFAAWFAADAAANGNTVTATRVWPAADYTRITLESARPIAHRLLVLDNPDRVVLDLEDVNPTAALNDLSGKISDGDPYVKSVRVGRFRPGVMRLVFDLKAKVRPQAFALAPIGDYGHRLVLDLYPLEPPDPLLALLRRHEALGEAAAPPAPAPRSEPPPPETAQAEAPRAPERAARAEPPRARADASRFIRIVIDPGHGGEDPGAVGRGGTYEKNIVLAISHKLKERIDREPHMRAILTREGDYFVPLHMRVEKARRVRADLFVSIHADAFIKPHARGSSVFALSESGATSAAARWLARRENEADLIGGVNLDVKDRYLKQTLLDLSQTAQINDSLKLGRAVLSELGGINTLHKNQVEQAGFAVLKAPDIPSILVETAFISNPDEERRLRDPAYQHRMAEAIFNGIRRYFAANPPLAREHVVMNP